jgi:cyclopropane fatty-acyl-phospholipid synthase-like methyltransferase
MTQSPPHSIPGSPQPRRAEDLYASPPPWDIGRPQPALQALADADAISGRVLDAGCGTGEHTLMAAALGLDATGIDLAGNALTIAEQKARDRGLGPRFLRHDARQVADLDEKFDTVLDCGLFHLFGGADRAAYLDGLLQVLRPGGRYFMLGFSDREPSDWPHKLRRDDISAAFADGWHIDSIEPATIQTRLDTGDVLAWLASLTRT